MEQNPLVMQIRMMESFFNKSVELLTDEDGDYKPEEGARTVIGQIAHTAQCVDWFNEGTFSETGYSMDFEKAEADVNACKSVTAAKEWFVKSCNEACELFGSKTQEELMLPIAGDIMGGMPRIGAINAMMDHTAHHRGSLAIYSRMVGKVPPMPYEE